MNDIDSLLRQNLEIEGILRVLLNRDSAEARQMLGEKAASMAHAVQQWLQNAEACGNDAVLSADKEPAREDNDGQADSHRPADIVETLDKEQAQGAEEPDQTELAEAAIERGQHEHAHAAAPRHNGGSPKVLKAFTLNDRFRFTRELFKGNEGDFSDTLRLLADMDTYAEAEDYLFNDMMWDAAEPGVADFMAILSSNMSK